MATKPNGKSPVSSASEGKVMAFRDITLGPHETQLHFRLINFWEAWNPIKKTLIGLEMLLIDEQGTVIQVFISPGRIEKYLSKMKRGSVYKFDNFYGTSNKTSYRVSEHAVTVSFSWNSALSILQDGTTPFEEDRFQFHSYEAFAANCDLKGDLYDVVDHMKLVNGQSLIKPPVLDEVEIAKATHLLISCSGPVMKLYLWDQAAKDFCKKFKAYENTPSVLLVTTVNTKIIGGTLALTSMSSSRVFMDYDVQPTIDYLGWLGSNPEIAEQVNAEVVTKREPLTIGEIFSYIKQESAKWVPYQGYQRTNFVDVYRARISVYDNTDQSVFVLLGDAGHELTERHASELVSSYFEVNGDQGVGHEVPVPEALISTIGQRHKFCVKVTEHNFSGKTRSLTVTKILSLDTPPATDAPDGNQNTATSEETVGNGNEVSEQSSSLGCEGSKRTCDTAHPETAKRPKCGD
ncbi:hypothetical protein Bca52824_016318 [Brassica carinata]|uniref:Replication protein A 70 kDa DNA-binding subunit B/D first OB fold domain-containing protein n=1 Tax=Brassica carinata TaxID=52824 RepID=A0A8X7W652_BRACI|nr:hypothetical protein Bca52824_016318 [Brassica carinata]